MTETASALPEHAPKDQPGNIWSRNWGIVCMPCNLGSWRHLPVVGHGRRLAILYGGGIFACRHCY